MHLLDIPKIANYVKSLSQDDGSFFGDKWGEVDTRFSYCALSILSLTGQLHSGIIDLKKAVLFIERFLISCCVILYVLITSVITYSCRNFDGGFGAVPGAESHAGQIFCCVGALSIAGALSAVDENLLGWWLSERQCDSGGLNGRPEKQPDVCYSWWILSTLSILGRTSWIDCGKLSEFILRCQDDSDGGISDRPDNMADVFHTFFGICGLSLMNYFEQEESGGEGVGAVGRAYRPVDPTYALPVDVIQRLGVTSQILPRVE